MLQRIFTGTFSECLVQALAPSCNCNSENALRMATNSHRTFLEIVMIVGIPLLHRIGGSMSINRTDRRSRLRAMFPVPRQTLLLEGFGLGGVSLFKPELGV